MVYIIGAGGVGSWLAPLISRLCKGEEIVVVDGDAFEEKNLDRQLFNRDHLGMNKADALAAIYGCKSIPRYIDRNCAIEFQEWDLIMSCVDNHAARNEILVISDRTKTPVIMGGNETYSAEAFIYFPEWKDTKLDPRVMYPEITTDKTGDPIAVSIGCIQLQQQGNIQLATANFMAASLMAHLLAVWKMSPPNKETFPHYPHLLSSTQTRLKSVKVKDVEPNAVCGYIAQI